jgi:hypothetical protein
MLTFSTIFVHDEEIGVWWHAASRLWKSCRVFDVLALSAVIEAIYNLVRVRHARRLKRIQYKSRRNESCNAWYETM